MKSSQLFAHPLLTLPNLLTCFRFVATPFLLGFAWMGWGVAFLILLAVCFLTDMLDGWAARRTGQVSEFGAVLDSWADVIIYLTISLCCWWLWPALVTREWLSVSLTVGSCLVPAWVGFYKFGCFTSYHTWTVKLAVVTTGFTLYLLVLGGPAWPFRLSALICLLAAIEEIGLTFLLSEPKADIRSIWCIVKALSKSKTG
ncbi:MAG: CDP-alcohol phosphatidyltransferase family protein [Methylovulum sp.]|jgi:CDP-diacylglycerol--glycerol-3-phosphate 3-phosphatidyltransferase|nr:CDP-alcohol phosphatidyltransferase family protein [Methylovulum sp.]MCF7999832.1 CDP-alcohol phosphatidyltransferase family protein [Methylovulum sp.]